MDAVNLRAGLVPLTTLHFSSSDEQDIRQQLQQKKSEAPALFRNLPCVLDLTGLEAGQISLTSLLALCTDSGLLPVGVRNAQGEWQAQAQDAGLADLGRGKIRTAETSAAHSSEGTATVAAPQRSVKVHRGNVRSGQQLYTDGDLIILGMVSAGAEVLATGDIHIYGALRGRALAGVKGDETAVIACQNFDAELVAIAGQYRLFETAPEQAQQTVVVALTDGNLNITSV